MTQRLLPRADNPVRMTRWLGLRALRVTATEAGRSPVPRRSMELATRALDEIREGRVPGLVHLLDDVEA